MSPKPLTFTLEEAVKRHPRLAILSEAERPRPPFALGRPAPPSSRPPRSSELLPQSSRVHALPPPVGPDRSLVAPPEPEAEPEPVAAKKKGPPSKYPDAVKAKAVARVLGGEMQRAVAEEIGCHQTVVSQWVQKAKKEAANEAKTKKRLATMAANKANKANKAEPTLVSAPRPNGAAPSAAPSMLLEGLEAWLEPVIDRLVGKALARRFGGGGS